MAANVKTERRRTVALSIRMSRKERDEIETMARQAGLGLSSYLRNCVAIATGRDSRFHVVRQ